MKQIPKYTLWLEVETGEPLDQPANRPTENFCNIRISTEDGVCYCLNVWTFDFLPLARYEWPYQRREEDRPSLYVIPPDLFVKRLDRETVTKVCDELFENGEMKEEWICIDD